MKKIILVVILIVVIGGVVYFLLLKNYEKSVKLEVKDKQINFMNLTSPVFKNNDKIPAKYTCDGENINPPLKISEVPEKAKSLVLIVDDPDATRGFTWLHWVVWNILPNTREIAENSVPDGGAVEGKTDFGKPGWGGPCPPTKTHRYFFKLFALDVVLDLSHDVSLDELQKAMEGHILDKSELIGFYSREK